MWSLSPSSNDGPISISLHHARRTAARTTQLPRPSNDRSRSRSIGQRIGRPRIHNSIQQKQQPPPQASIDPTMGSRPRAAAAATTAALLLGALGCAAAACLGPPYIYLTLHGGEGKGDINNIQVRFPPTWCVHAGDRSIDKCMCGSLVHTAVPPNPTHHKRHHPTPLQRSTRATAASWVTRCTGARS